MRYLFSILILLYAFPSFAFNNIEGFRNYKWGDAPPVLQNAILIKKNGDITIYKKIDEKLFIGDTSLKSITYNFYKEQLMSVVITGKSIDIYLLGDAFDKKYGKRKAWQDDWRDSYGSIDIITNHKNPGGDGLIIFLSREVFDEYMKDKDTTRTNDF